MWERIGRGNLLLRCRRGRLGGALGSTEGGEGRGYIASSARLQLGDICTLLLTSYREVQSSGTFSYLTFFNLPRPAATANATA